MSVNGLNRPYIGFGTEKQPCSTKLNFTYGFGGDLAPQGGP